MSDPLSDRCAYCGSTAVLDDAWFCQRDECFAAFMAEAQAEYDYNQRTALTLAHARSDIALAGAHLFWESGLARLRGAEERWLATVVRVPTAR